MPKFTFTKYSNKQGNGAEMRDSWVFGQWGPSESLVKYAVDEKPGMDAKPDVPETTHGGKDMESQMQRDMKFMMKE